MKRGWIVTFAGLGINIALGVVYGWSAIAAALTRSAAEGGLFLWTPRQAMLPYAVAVGCFSLSMLIAGRLQDSFGPRLVATGGGGLIGVGMLVASLSPAHLVSPNAVPVRMMLGFGVLAGCGVGMTFAATIPAAAKWASAGRRGVRAGQVSEAVDPASVPTEVWAQWRANPDYAPGGGEPLSALGVRVRAACEELTAAADLRAGRTVVVVTHVSPIKAAIAWALGVEDRVAWRLWVDDAGVTRIGVDRR